MHPVLRVLLFVTMVCFTLCRNAKELLRALACAFYWSSLRDCTSGLVAGSRDSEEHA